MSNNNNNNNSNNGKDGNRRPLAVPTNFVVAPIQGAQDGSSADKSRPKTATPSVGIQRGSDPSPPTTSLKSGTPDVRGLSRPTQVATGSNASQKEGAVTKTPDPVDVDSDEFYLDSDNSADNEYWRLIAKNFAVKPTDSKLPKMGLAELKEQVEFRGGYHMVKPKELQS